MYNIKDIKSPSFVKKLSNRQLNILCDDIREFLIESISKTGGHLSSNLGVVELTVALHKVFDTPTDKIIWDVGHQSYIHKILTGRASDFTTLRQHKGLSGFPKRKESVHDCWETGHASTSISAGVGMAFARDLNHENYHVVAVIGDGSMTGGMAYEALNHIGHSNKRLIVILNDNEMAIGPNVGALHHLLASIRTNDTYISTKRHVKELLKNTDFLNELLHRAKDSVKNFFLDDIPFSTMGFKYIGPIDGHNMNDLVKTLNFAKNYQEGPILIHVKTKKGKGYSFAEADKQGAWHGVGKFDLATGEVYVNKQPDVVSWSKLIANGLIELTKHDERVSVITPAMINGSALNEYAKVYPDRLIDVGIAEEHAVTMAAGMSAVGMKPFVSIYSTFFKRAYDQVHHDVARQDLNVVFGIDRAGIVGADGETHQGIYDIAMLRHIPNMHIMMPKDAKEAYCMLKTAYQNEGPFAIRYPRGNVKSIDAKFNDWLSIELGSWEVMKEGKDLVVISMGPVLTQLQDLLATIQVETGYDIGLVNARFIKPMDEALLTQIASLNVPVLVYEESTLIGGLGAGIIEYYNNQQLNVSVTRMGIEDIFVQHGDVNLVLEELQLSIQDIENKILKLLEK